MTNRKTRDRYSAPNNSVCKSEQNKEKLKKDQWNRIIEIARIRNQTMNTTKYRL